MKAEAKCKKCGKNVKIKGLYLCNGVINIYLTCGHHYHWHLNVTIIED